MGLGVRLRAARSPALPRGRHAAPGEAGASIAASALRCEGISPPPRPGDSAGVRHGACSGAYFIAENRGVWTKRLQTETELDLLTVKWMHLTYKIRCHFFQKNSLLTGSTGRISKYEGRNATPSGGGAPPAPCRHTPVLLRPELRPSTSLSLLQTRHGPQRIRSDPVMLRVCFLVLP